MSNLERRALRGRASAQSDCDRVAHRVAQARHMLALLTGVSRPANALDPLELALGVDVIVLPEDALDTYFPDRNPVKAV